MRYLNIVLGVLMLAFASLQYNDPDALQWIAIYAVAAAGALAAAFSPSGAASAPGRALLALSVLAYVVLVAYYWPQTPAFWRKDVWWHDEEAREGMGVMIALAVLLVVFVSAFTARSPRS